MNDGDDESAPADPVKLRRFAIGIALVMFVYVAAGGIQADNHITVEMLKVTLLRPKFLVWAIPIVAVYASVRYWWYAIKLPVTRRKIRKYLQRSRSLLVIKTWESNFRNDILTNRTSAFMLAIGELATKVPAGLSPYSFIIFTDAYHEPDDNYMFHLCRNRIDTYFSGIGAKEFQVDESQDHHAWISPSKLRFNTQAWVIVEDSDLWLPIVLNVIGLLLFLLYLLCPGDFGHKSIEWI